MKAKICGISDSNTLIYITNHPYPPEYIGFIVNYKKSKRFVEFNELKRILKIKKKKSKYVAVLVKPTNEELKKITKLPFDYYQIYGLKSNEIKSIKEKYKVKIIVAITVKDKNDVLMYKNYKDVADIILFDSKGYEKSMSFDHKLIKNLKSNTKIMLAGNIQLDDDLDNYKKITDIIDISGGLETSGLKDISKINIFLNKIKKIKNET
jgi:phosphoribosylanthranilate isomerase